MSNLVRDLVIRYIIRPQQPGRKEAELSSFVIAKGFRELKLNVWNATKDVALIGLGVASATFGLKGFLLPNHYIDGGATGVALMVEQLTAIPLPLLLVLINAPFVYLAYRFIGRPFAIRTAGGISTLSLVVGLVHIPSVTSEPLLATVFGGFFLGAGIGLAVRGGGVIDGTEVLAIAVSRKLRVTVGDVITSINVVIFTVAAMLLGPETALYSMITYLAASKTMDFVIEGIEEYVGVTIISSHHEELRSMITVKLQRGITVLRGKRGFGRHGHNHDVDVLYCVITRFEVGRLSDEVEKIDPNAFVVMSPVKDISGGIVKKRRHKH